MWGAGASSREAIGSDWVLGRCPLGGLEERLGLPPLPPRKNESLVWLRLPALEAGHLGLALTPPPCPYTISPHCPPSQSYCPQLAPRGGEQWELAG